MFADWFLYFWEQITHIDVVLPEIFNLPWMWVALQPLRLIGPVPALVLMQLGSLVVIIRLGRELQVPLWRMVMVILSAPVGCSVLFGHFDGLLLIAYSAPPALAAFIALCKPQTAGWAGWNAFGKEHWLVFPAALLLLSAYLIWGWPFSTSDPKGLLVSTGLLPPLLQRVWNWSLFPISLLLVPAFLKGDRLRGMLITPFLFPYAGLQSLIGPMLALGARSPWWAFVLAWLAMWVRFAWLLNRF